MGSIWDDWFGLDPVTPPSPSSEERDYYRAMYDLLQGQREENALLKPLLYKNLGIKIQDGKVVEIPWEDRLAAMTPFEKAQYDLATQYTERQKKALSGDLPISPALEKDLAEQEKNIKENLSRRLGTDWETSTPGILAMSDFKKRADLLREESRRGQLSTGEGLLASRLGYLTGSQGQQYGQLQNTGARSYGLINAYGQALNAYQPYRQMQYGINMQNAVNEASLLSSLFQAAGYVGGMRAGRG